MRNFQQLCNLTFLLNKDFDSIKINEDTFIYHIENAKNPYNSFFLVKQNNKEIIKTWSVDLLFKKLLKRGLV